MDNLRGLWRGKVDEGEKKGQWVYGYRCKYPSPIQIGAYTGPWYIQVPPKDPDDEGGVYHVDPETLGECCGNTDRDNTLIFEKDYIELDLGVGRAVGRVAYEPGTCSFVIVNAKARWSCGMRVSGKMKILGNTVDTPELMEVHQNEP